MSFGEGGYFHVTGTTTITDIDFSTAKDGRWAWVIFDGALTLTHNGTTLLLPGNANIQTAAGDRALFIQDSSDNIICASYQRAGAAPSGGINLGTVTASTSGTSIDFTGIPPWAKRITVYFIGVSFNNTAVALVQLGDAGGIENSGYAGSGGESGASSVNYTSGFSVGVGTGAAGVTHGAMYMNLADAANNTWVATGMFGRSDSAAVMFYAGRTSTTTVVTQLRITTVAGTATFDAGSINITWE